MSSATYFRLLKEHHGNAQDALRHACATIDYFAANVSFGLLRIDRGTPAREPKVLPEPLDVPPATEEVDL